MAKNVKEIPATEIVERSRKIARDSATNDESIAWGALNDLYVREIPSKADWSFLYASSSLTCLKKHADGTVSVNTGDTAVTFSSNANISTSFSGRKIKLTNNPNIYDLTLVSTTNGTIAPALSEDKNISAGGYTIYESRYALAPNFGRFPKNGGLQLMQGGQITPIPEMMIQTHYNEFTPSTSKPDQCRLITHGTAGVTHVELKPPPDKAYVLPYDYIIDPHPLRETTGGTATVEAGSSTVIIHGGAASISEAGTGWMFRVNAFGQGANSEWYRVLAISGSTLTLNLAFALTGATSAGYTLSMVPAYPVMLHQALLDGVVKSILSDQNDRQFIYADSRQTAVINDAKRLYRTRTYNQPIEMPMEDIDFRR